MSHVAHMQDPWLICEWVVSQVWISHVKDMNESCHTPKSVMLKVGMSRVAHMNEWVMSHTWKSHVAHMNESGRRYKWVMSNIYMSRKLRRDLHINESCHTHEWVMSHIWMSHFAYTNESWVINCVEIHSSTSPYGMALVSRYLYLRWYILISIYIDI